MKLNVIRSFCKIFLLVAAGFFLSSFVSNRGGESYEVYLGSKLLVRQSVLQYSAVQNITLNALKPGDELVVYYNHCGRSGTGRTIALKYANGKTAKAWKFDNSRTADSKMAIPAKELIPIYQSAASLGVYYSSDQLPNGKMLVILNTKSTAIALRR